MAAGVGFGRWVSEWVVVVWVGEGTRQANGRWACTCSMTTHLEAACCVGVVWVKLCGVQ